MLLKVFRHSAIHIKKTQQHNGTIVLLCFIWTQFLRYSMSVNSLQWCRPTYAAQIKCIIQLYTIAETNVENIAGKYFAGDECQNSDCLYYVGDDDDQGFF